MPAIVALLADDALGKGREGAAAEAYLAAFHDIAANPMHQLIVGEDAGRTVACAQLTILHGLSRGGARSRLMGSDSIEANHGRIGAYD